MAYNNKLKISLDLASYNVVEANKDFLDDILSRYVDIVFANEDEARALTGLDQPNEALFQIANKCEIAVVKLGVQGSIIKKAEFFSKVNAVTAQSVDTTGAGDLYAAGFLYGLVQKLPLTKCAEIGSLIASKVVEVSGARICDDKWLDINNAISRL
jgi:sugar/nucleoside kinase (ribokinase family)